MNKKRSLAVAGSAAVVLVGSLTFGAIAASSNPSPALDEQGPAALSVDPTDGSKVITDRLDNVEKKVGESAVLADDGGNRLFTINITKVTTAKVCQARVGSFQLKPEKGMFLILDVEATMSRGAAREVRSKPEDLFMPLAPQAFSVMGPSGVIEREVASEPAWGCLADKDLAPAALSPGQEVSGKVVLDVPYGSGAVVYDPINNGGWSWPY